MPSITTHDGVRLDYVSLGDETGRAVILLAGFKAPGTSWKYQLPALTEAGYRVLVVDLRSHGASEHPATGLDMERLGGDVHEVLTALDIRDAVLVGGSMGGNTIWSYVEQFGYDRVGAIAIVDQTPKMLNARDWPYGFYEYDRSNVDTYFAERIPDTGRGTPISLKGMRLVRLLSAMKGAKPGITPGELSLLHDHATADWRDVVASAPVPVLFVAGAESEHWPAGHAAVSAALAAHGTSVVIPRDGHAANIEQPRAFNAALLGWLRG